MSLTRSRQGAGEPLVLIHGLGGAASNWDPVVPALAEHRDVIVIEPPGFGESPPFQNGTPWTIAALTDAIEAELGDLGVGSVHACGNSMGGWIALELAARGRALTCVAISPVGGGRRDERAVMGLQLLVGRMALERLPDQVTLGFGRTPAGRQALKLAFARPRRLSEEQIERYLRDYARAPGVLPMLRFLTEHTPDNLGAITCPTAIVWGTRDRLLRFRQAHHFVDAIAGATLHPLEGLGHTPMSDDPDQVAAAILEHTTS